MKTKMPGISLVVSSAAISIAVLGCAVPAKFSGGGSLPSTSGVAKDKAILGFNAADCAPGVVPPVGHFNFHDKAAPLFAATGGLKMSGFAVAAGECISDVDAAENLVVACDESGTAVPVGFCPPDSSNVGIDIQYVSTNPKLPGVGLALACVHDGGEGVNASPDLLALQVLSGPYFGYANTGAVSGNLQQQTCSCTDGIDNDADGLIDALDPGCNLINGLNGDESGA